MNKATFGAMLADNFLAMVNPFGSNLVDTGKGFLHNGTQCPVFKLNINDEDYVYVYRYTPVNSETSRLAFLP